MKDKCIAIIQKQVIIKTTILWLESYKTLTQIWKDSPGMVLGIPSTSQTYRFTSDFKACYHFWWMWPGILKFLRIASMQCLCNISKKKWFMKLIFFYMLINLKFFYKLIVLFLMGLARHAQITRVNLQYLCDISRNKLGIKSGTYLHWLFQILLL